MLKKIYRLSSVRLVKQKHIRSMSFDLRFAKNNLGFPRFGFVISKKIDKSAVVRNLLKRKLSKCAEEIFDRIEGGYDFVFYPRTNSLESAQEELKKEIEKVFIKEKILNV